MIKLIVGVIFVLVCIGLGMGIYYYFNPVIYDCIIGNQSIRDNFFNDHPEMENEQLRTAWKNAQSTVLIPIIKKGFCDKVVYE